MIRVRLVNEFLFIRYGMHYFIYKCDDMLPCIDTKPFSLVYVLGPYKIYTRLLGTTEVGKDVIKTRHFTCKKIFEYTIKLDKLKIIEYRLKSVYNSLNFLKNEYGGEYAMLIIRDGPYYTFICTKREGENKFCIL